MKDVTYHWQDDYLDTYSVAERVAAEHGWGADVTRRMTEIVSPEEAQTMKRMAYAWRAGTIPGTTDEDIGIIYEAQRQVAREELGMTEAQFQGRWNVIYAERIKNPALAYHMLNAQAHHSPTYGTFLEQVPSAKCMLFTSGIAWGLNGSFGALRSNPLGGNVTLDDPCIVWCEKDIGCRYDRDRGDMLLEGIFRDLDAWNGSTQFTIAVYGAGYLTEMICTGWLQNVINTGKRVDIYACDMDQSIDLELLLPRFMESRGIQRWEVTDRVITNPTPGSIREYHYGNLTIKYFYDDMSTLVDRLKAMPEVGPRYVLAKGVMSYNLDDGNGRDETAKVVKETLLQLNPRDEVRFDLQLEHPVNLRNGLVFGWGFPVERTLKQQPNGITLLTPTEVGEWLDKLRKQLAAADLPIPSDHVEVAYISDDLGAMTAVIRIVRP